MKTNSWKIKLLTIQLLAIILLGNEGLCAKSKGHFFAATEKILITPQTPLPMSGYASRKAPFKGVHDDIYARVLVVGDGTKNAAIISTEIIGISDSFWSECTPLISKATGIPVEYIFLSAVHNHNGPSLSVYEEATPDVQAYKKELMNKLVQSTKLAVNNLKPATIGIGKGESKMNINRVAPDGKGGTTLGLNPYGTCDHELTVLKINDDFGIPLAMLINWPCHAVCLGPKNYFISGDWPGVAASYVESKIGKGVVAPIVIGASGDINPLYGPHVDFEVNNSYSFGKDAIGEDVGKEAIRVAGTIKVKKISKINAIQRTIYLALKDSDNNMLRYSDKPDSMLVRLSAMKIGDVVITGVSGEVFNEISLNLRKRSPYSNTFMITHCNGSCGYLITDKTYVIGGYETKSTRAKIGAEKAIVENLLDMIKKL
ncbi:hypothetical protein SDC9_67958 [bioreactor metagenome]|uniref:Neutral/alkaline non-lysosomal ceramidase N-terminal domain-containing protein n=1 Tax=bioreactor metagenome TaxID=1076179 RepID=A0A644Y5Q5_9ZZZZ|nr:neutral/alkaline non-lysosomal ceramidase N-terminal domain-containing protein [Paludibacter sp.]